MHYTEGKKPVSKATQYMIPFTYHHGKGKTIGAVDSCIEGRQGLELGERASRTGGAGEWPLAGRWYSTPRDLGALLFSLSCLPMTEFQFR